jgi:succinate dehydrogenase/fumarate reductase flavoprotein subunit
MGSYAISSQPDRLAYIVFDERIAQKFNKWPYYISTGQGVAYAYLADYRRNRKDIFRKAATVKELADKLGISDRSLEETVKRYNGFADQSKDEDFGRNLLGQGIQIPPFYALGPLKSYVAFTEGGLEVTPHMEVLDKGGKVIKGLFAAGSVGQGGVLLYGHGSHLLWAFTSGRIAGRNVTNGKLLSLQ